jgi:hypothetical protein
MKFQDLPKFTAYGRWECDYPIEDVPRALDKWADPKGDYRDCPLDLDPDFQRLHVWNQEQQISWLEFILKGGKTGRVIYLNCSGWMGIGKKLANFVLVDGKQRVEAIRRFLRNEIPVFGYYRRDFEDRMRILDGMKIHVNNLATRAEVLQWYIEMNVGGTPHTAWEIAKAVRLLEAEKRANKL